MDNNEIVIVGAGVSGLACASALRDAGREAVILERALRVGGRCATRHVDGQPVDHGACFLHGSDPDFVALLESLPGTYGGWPRRIVGSGPPCQPRAYTDGETRVVPSEGVAALPRRLAEGLEVRFDSKVRAIALGDDHVGLEVAGRTTAPRTLRARTVVFALAFDQVWKLLKALPPAAPIDPLRRLALRVGTDPSLTVLAGYPLEGTAVDFEALHPSETGPIQSIFVDSSKRVGPAMRVLVIQSNPAFARTRLHTDPHAWSEELLAAAAAQVGPWVARPRWKQAHRWCYARAVPGTEQAEPTLLTLPGGARIGICGENFAPMGGVEAAFLSGRRLAALLG
ncbi:NAD(P)/FAD-dependent oxidoreductase [Vulgatibacter sp.]|uniref:NAD(P)/FAD-dependent oxidoreductase n=1 Tax=Vulgatibacter sp. TaxID=1971226 RepID=UPI0035678960